MVTDKTEISDITEHKVWTTKQLVKYMIAAVIATNTLTMIYAEFRVMQNEIKVNSEREDKRDKRSIEDRRTIWQAIDELKGKHDNKK